MKRDLGTLLATVFTVWVIAYMFLAQVSYSQSRGNNLTEFYDAYSEANGIRAGHGYADRGFAYNYGLPEVSYGNAFDSVGGKYDKNLCPSIPCVYLHYPPGPDLVIGAMVKTCGKADVACLRTAPLLFNLVCLITLAVGLWRAFGIRRTAFVVGAMALVPMASNAFHYLHYHSYVTGLMYMQIGILAVLFSSAHRLRNLLLIPLFGVGALAGASSFDYVFHVTLISVPVWLAMPNPRGLWKRLVWATLVVCAGYGLLNVLHFYQVRLFLGSWDAVYQDFSQRAAIRAGGALEAGIQKQAFLRLLMTYLVRFLPEAHMMAMNFVAVLLAAATALLPRTAIVISQTRRLVWAPGRTYILSLATAFVIPTLWLLVMRQHATVHGHFLPRHFMLTYVMGALLLALSVKRSPSETATPP